MSILTSASLPSSEFLALLRLLQLASPALPVGAYGYSEGLEFLVHAGVVSDRTQLQHWLTQELRYGTIRLDAAIMARGYRAMTAAEFASLLEWNRWLSAVRDAEELRLQSWQMGRSLLRLWCDLQSEPPEPDLVTTLQADGCNFAIAYAIVAASWQIDLDSTLLSYLYGWVANLVSAGIKLIPLGHTAGQQLLSQMQSNLVEAIADSLALEDADLCSCGWGLALASMAHEAQYSRLFRS